MLIGNYFKIPCNKNRIRPPDTDFRAHMQNKGPRSRRCGWQSRPGPCAAAGKPSAVRPWRSPGGAVLRGHPLLKAPRRQRNCRARSESGTGLVPPEDILFLVQPFLTVASWLAYILKKYPKLILFFFSFKNCVHLEAKFPVTSVAIIPLALLSYREHRAPCKNQLRLSREAKNYSTANSSKLVCKGKGSSACYQKTVLL